MKLPNYAGIVQYRRSRHTGTIVGVYDNNEQGFEDPAEGLRWWTVCEDHGTLVGHSTKKAALEHAPYPENWCDECREAIHGPAMTPGGTPLRDAW